MFTFFISIALCITCRHWPYSQWKSSCLSEWYHLKMEQSVHFDQNASKSQNLQHVFKKYSGECCSGGQFFQGTENPTAHPIVLRPSVAKRYQKMHSTQCNWAWSWPQNSTPLTLTILNLADFAWSVNVRYLAEVRGNHLEPLFFRFSVSTFHLLVRVLLCPCKGAWCSGSSRTFAPCCAPYVLTKALQLLVLVHRHLALCPGMRWRCRNLKAFPLLFTDFLALHANVNLYSKYNLRWVFVAYREVLPPPMPDVLQYWKKAGLKLLNNLDEKVSTIFNFYPDTSWTWSFD